ncbi:uncharacterized protein EAF02_000631 [Botrytis sinoallii]|uniref:uncharacterized protein n=1 Tax=Botrytis sinoallii TaxID=1463999 RepID=UPI0019000B21|nr:uncharacterized protein EAF02_000631 [Botrytis sinoallii]KAF7893093.1 hypothetical protein EAF02_000631 [Botrytis sinoallii]
MMTHEDFLPNPHTRKLPPRQTSQQKRFSPFIAYTRIQIPIFIYLSTYLPTYLPISLSIYLERTFRSFSHSSFFSNQSINQSMNHHKSHGRNKRLNHTTSNQLTMITKIVVVDKAKALETMVEENSCIEVQVPVMHIWRRHNHENDPGVVWKMITLSISHVSVILYRKTNNHITKVQVMIGEIKSSIFQKVGR